MLNSPSAKDPLRVIRLPEVKNLTGIGRSRLYDLLGRGEFPRPIRLGPASVGWIEAEVTEWIAVRVRERDRKAKP